MCITPKIQSNEKKSHKQWTNDCVYPNQKKKKNSSKYSNKDDDFCVRALLLLLFLFSMANFDFHKTFDLSKRFVNKPTADPIQIDCVGMCWRLR